MTALRSQVATIFHADHLRKTEMLGDVGYWEDRVHCIANHATQVIRALLSETELYTTQISHLQVDVQA
jgi:hypothetical protein